MALRLWPLLLLLSGLAGMPLRSAAPELGGCALFPANSVFNTRVDTLPLHPMSDAWVNSIGAGTGLHPDFGTVWEGAPIGIPYTVALTALPPVTVTFTYTNESDPSPYPIPLNPAIEGGAGSSGDRHVLWVYTPSCALYELYAAYPQPNGTWQAGSGARWDLGSNALRPDTWTSADAAGLPILPLLVRYDEVQAGEIRHALRFTADITQKAHLWPARHDASDNTSPNRPPMGARFRLKASVDISSYAPEIQTIFTAMKRYGMFLADNGSNWYVSGAHDMQWDDDLLVGAFSGLSGSDFEVVNESALMVNVDSGRVREPMPTRAWLPVVTR
ncbi:MAG: hypothetical protein ABIQ99_13840 [Thermoflexales bacterium]